MAREHCSSRTSEFCHSEPLSAEVTRLPSKLVEHPRFKSPESVAHRDFVLWKWWSQRGLQWHCSNGGEGWIRTSVRLRGQIYSLPLSDSFLRLPRGHVASVYRRAFSDPNGGPRRDRWPALRDPDP